MKTEKCHFWVGRFETQNLYFDFVAEDESLYELEDSDDAPISKFAKSQGEIWIDHDFMETGFEEPTDDIKKQFSKYSYAYNWGEELERRCSTLKLDNINTLIFLNQDQISSPTSVEGAGFKLEYIGVIEYKI